MQFLIFLFFSVLCSCWYMYKICSYNAESLPQKDLFYLKEKDDPDQAKTPHSNTPPPPCLRHEVEIFA